MSANNPQVPWTDEQWARVNQVIQEEARRARLAATFLPLYGPLPPDTDFVRAEIVNHPAVPAPPAGLYYPAATPLPQQHIRINDRDTIQLATLQVKVYVRSSQVADQEMTTVLTSFRRAANVLARLEDAVVFRGLVPVGATPTPVIPPGGLAGLVPGIWEISGGQAMPGLWGPPAWPWGAPFPVPLGWQWIPVAAATGQALVQAVSQAIGRLEAHGHFGPFAAVLGQRLFLIAQTPDPGSLVLPQDRIIPFLGGGSLLRSSTLDAYNGNIGVVVALGGAPIELIVARDMSLQFLLVTSAPNFLFRVSEKIVLRIKEAEAIVRIYLPPRTLRAVGAP